MYILETDTTKIYKSPIWDVSKFSALLWSKDINIYYYYYYY